FISKYSPVTYMDADMPPMLIIHGNDDRVVPVEQSITLHEQLTKLGVTHEFHIIEGVDHAFRGVSLEQKRNIQEWTVAFIRRNYSSDN
ncbi:MAG: prolyl oligopeptidase family serine peptidase, partial [Marinoscillum sp.]